MKAGSGLAPLSQPVSEDQTDPVREYMRQMAAESASEPEPGPVDDTQRGFMIGDVRL